MSRLIYLNRPSLEVVVDIINVSNPNTVTAADISLERVTSLVPANVPLINKNTRAVIKTTDGSNFVGERTVFYNRLDIGILFGGVDAGIPVDIDSTQHALSLLNEYYGLAIAEDEIDLSQQVIDGMVDIIITKSLVYVPGSKVRLASNGDLVWFENAVDLYHEYVNFTLYTALTAV